MTTAQRKHFVTLAHELYAHRDGLGYPPGDRRTSLDVRTWHLSESELFFELARREPLQFDCSLELSWAWRCCGLPGMTQFDFTGSFLKRMPVYTDAKLALPGAGVIFGPGDGHHGAGVIEEDPKWGNPLLGSHGRPGYDIVRLRDLENEQTAMGYPGVRFVSVAHL